MHRAASGLLLLALAGCGIGSSDRDDMKADTARFEYGGRTATVPLVDCGREDDVVILAGKRGDIVVQAAADVGEDGDARTGATVDLGGEDGIWGVFGADLEQGPAGEITDVAIEGDRVIVEGTWAQLDENLAVVPDAQEIEAKLVARCPEDPDSNRS